MGVFPAVYPKELLWAHNILPVEIWDPPLEITRANSHLQSYICPIVKGGLELILQEPSEVVDGYLFPHTCDSIQNLASIVNDHLDTGKPCLFFYHPKAPYGTSTPAYYKNQLIKFSSQLDHYFGPVNPDQLNKSIRISRHIYDQLDRLFKLRQSGSLPVSNREFYAILRSGEYLWPTDYQVELENLIGRKSSKSARTRAVVLSGILPNPPEILDLLDAHNVQIAADDLLNCQRRLAGRIPAGSDSLDVLTEAYFSKPPCSTRASATGTRIKYLKKLTSDSGAQGIIFCIPKFCEPELFDLPQLRQDLNKANIPSLVVETEIRPGLSGQLTTRLEAFMELFGA